jgi:hypothetical protein
MTPFAALHNLVRLSLIFYIKLLLTQLTAKGQTSVHRRSNLQNTEPIVIVQLFSMINSVL